MTINLIFKRTVNGKIEMKVVPTNIYGIEPGEGWSLVSSADSIEIIDNSMKISSSTECIKNEKTESEVKIKTEELSSTSTNNTIEKPNKNAVTKRVTGMDATGSSKLVRVKGRIFIAKRRPSDSQSLNCIFISDGCRMDFFNSVKEAHGRSTSEYSLYECNQPYSFWNSWMDDAYKQIINI